MTDVIVHLNREIEAKAAETIILHDTFMEQIWGIEEEKRNVENELL